MLVKTLTLKDFQPHEELKLELSPGITTIMGPSDRGKSAVLRALRWLCLNDFAGDDFIREGAKHALVKLRIGTHSIGRGRGQGGNVYTLDDQEFKAFGASVPDPIAKVLQLSELNFQAQHDAPFWFSLGAAEVSRQLNSVIDLSVIDTALSDVGSRVRTANERVNLTKELLTTAQEKLDEIEWQALRVDQFDALKAKRKTYQKLYFDCDELQAILDSIAKNKAAQLAEQAEEAAELSMQARRVLNAVRDIEDLEVLLEDIRQQRADATPPPDFEPVEEAHTSWMIIQDKLSDLSTLVLHIEQAQITVTRTAAQAESREAAFHKTIKGQRCPLCQNKL